MDDTLKNIIDEIIIKTGKAIIILGAISSLIIWSAVGNKINGTTGFIYALCCFIATFITGIFFIGFGEIIFLLRDISKNDKTLVSTLQNQGKSVLLNSQSYSSKSQNKSVDSKPKHLFRCVNCGNMIEKYPCEYCDYKFN